MRQVPTNKLYYIWQLAKRESTQHAILVELLERHNAKQDREMNHREAMRLMKERDRRAALGWWGRKREDVITWWKQRSIQP